MNKSVIDSDIFLKFHGFYTRMYSSHYWISKIKFKTTLRGLYFLPNILGGLIVGYIFNYIFTK